MIADGFIVQRGMRLGVGGDRLEPCKLDNAEIIPNEIPSANAVAGDGSPEHYNDKLPVASLSSLNDIQQRMFLHLWNKTPAFLLAIHFDVEEPLDSK